MPQFRSRRQNRYNKLIDGGFAKGEAYPLSKLASNNILLIDLIQQRRTELKGARTKKEVEIRLDRLYRQNGWLKPGAGIIKGKQQKDTWKMFRYYEDLYKKYNPDYGVRNKTRDFIDTPYNPTKKRQKR